MSPDLTKHYNIIAVIPARGNSKRIPRKNVKLLGGKPLIVWTIEAAFKCRLIDRIIVSTDDDEIAEISRKNNAEVPFIRPADLAKDDTPDLPVCRHLLEYLAVNENYQPDIIVWLRPTCPLRRPEDIEAAVKKLIETNADCVRSVTQVEQHPYWMKRLEGDKLMSFIKDKDEQIYYQRQMLPILYCLNGAVDVVWSRNIGRQPRLFSGNMSAVVTPPEFSVDIDTEFDFILADAILKKVQND